MVRTPGDPAGAAVRAARSEDLPAFLELLEEAGARAGAAGVRPGAPGSQRGRAPGLAQLVAEGALLLAEDADGLVAGGILTRAVTPAWEDVPGDALVVPALAVAGRGEGLGLGRRLLARMGALARREGAELLRLDCEDGSSVLRALDRAVGMREREAVDVGGCAVRRFEHRLADGPLAAAPLPLAEPVPRIPPPARRTAEPLPPYRYLPGRAPHPVRHPRGHARDAPPPDLTDLDAARIERARVFRRGADLFDAAYWWEAHEAWEAIWVALGRRGPGAAALRGLIQVAAACLKRFLGEGATAARLAERGLGALGPRPAGLPALDTRALATAVRAYVACEDGRPPVIPRTGDGGAEAEAPAAAAECR